MDRSVDLLVEVGVSHVARDRGVAADAELTDPPCALIGVERGEQEVLLRLSRGVDDAALRDAKPDAPHVASAPDAGELGEGDRALGRRLDRAAEELAARHVPGA